MKAFAYLKFCASTLRSLLILVLNHIYIEIALECRLFSRKSPRFLEYTSSRTRPSQTSICTSSQTSSLQVSRLDDLLSRAFLTIVIAAVISRNSEVWLKPTDH